MAAVHPHAQQGAMRHHDNHDHGEKHDQDNTARSDPHSKAGRAAQADNTRITAQDSNTAHGKGRQQDRDDQDAANQDAANQDAAAKILSQPTSNKLTIAVLCVLCVLCCALWPLDGCACCDWASMAVLTSHVQDPSIETYKHRMLNGVSSRLSVHGAYFGFSMQPSIHGLSGCDRGGLAVTCTGLHSTEAVHWRSSLTGANSTLSVHIAYSGSSTRRRDNSGHNRFLTAESSSVMSLGDTEAIHQRSSLTGANSTFSIHIAYSGSSTRRRDDSRFDRVLSAGSLSLVMSQEGRAHMIVVNLCSREGWGGC